MAYVKPALFLLLDLFGERLVANGLPSIIENSGKKALAAKIPSEAATASEGGLCSWDLLASSEYGSGIILLWRPSVRAAKAGVAC